MVLVADASTRALPDESDLAALLRVASELTARAAQFDASRCNGSEAREVLGRLSTVEKACAAARLRAATRVDECGAYRATNHRSAASMMAEATGTSAGAAAAALEAAEALADHEVLAEAFRRGELSPSQVQAVAPAATANPGAAADLLRVARTGTLRQLRDTARKVRLDTVDPDALYLRQRRLREHRQWTDDDGMVCGRYRLTPDAGAVFRARIQHEVDRLYRGAPAAARESSLAYAADALLTLTDGSGSPAGEGRAGRRGGRRTAKVEAVVVIDLPALLRGRVRAGERCHVLGVGPVPVGVVRSMMANAFIKGVVSDGVDIRKVRHFKRYRQTELRTALGLGPLPALNGVVCVADGCDRTLGLEWDHVDPVANRGPTSADNLVPLCAPHHREKTARDRAAGLLGPNPPCPP